MASLDTQKAFDVVWQDSLAIHLFMNKPEQRWQVHIKLLEDTELQVCIGDHLSQPFLIDQGVCQGKTL